jgi:hypothetical protein
MTQNVVAVKRYLLTPARSSFSAKLPLIFVETPIRIMAFPTHITKLKPASAHADKTQSHLKSSIYPPILLALTLFSVIFIGSR